MTGSRRYVPKGRAWTEQLFDKKVLSEPDGVLYRKVTSVERNASEGLLIDQAGLRGFVVTRQGSHYSIHRPFVTPIRLTKTLPL